MKRRSWKPNSGRACSNCVAVAMVAIVIAFVLGTAWMWRRLNATQQALSMATNGSPSVRYLAEARTHLRAEREAAAEFVFRSGGAGAQQAMQVARKDLLAAIDSELTTPSYPGEDLRSVQVAEALGELERRSQRLSPSPDLNDARRRFLDYSVSVDRLDDRLARLESHNATFLQADAEELFARQRSARTSILLFDGGMVVVAWTLTFYLFLALRRSFKEMEQRNRELEMFSARVAHDLMSPLQTVMLALTATERHHTDEATARLTRSALHALERSRTVVDGLLSFARTAGKPLADARCRVRPIVAGVLDDATPTARANGIELVQERVPECEVACEPGMLTVLLSNLVNNAIKFMGESSLRRVVVRVEEQRSCVRFEVEDSGPGFPRELRPMLFDPYARASSKTPGLGLGLATVKRLAEAHGGRVGAQRLAASTLFWFELPKPPRRVARGGELSPAWSS